MLTVWVLFDSALRYGFPRVCVEALLRSSGRNLSPDGFAKQILALLGVVSFGGRIILLKRRLLMSDSKVGLWSQTRLPHVVITFQSVTILIYLLLYLFFRVVLLNQIFPFNNILIKTFPKLALNE